MTAIKAGAPIGEAKKLLAVKRVTFPIRGRRPPGVDGVLWKGARAKWRAACGLRRRGYIKNGFTLPGQTFRKYGRKLHITPSKEGVPAFILKVGTIIRKHVSAPIPVMIKKLNQMLRGWANYHRHLVASEAFSRIDTYVFEQPWRMLRKRHPGKPKKWLFRKHWTASGKKHIFAVLIKTRKDPKRVYQVIRTCSIGIRRHIKIKAAANPYPPEFARYFWQRRNNKENKLLPALSAREFRAMFA